MNNKFVFVVVALFVMQGYALNMNVQDVVLDIEQAESTTSGRSTNVMPAISDTMQQYMLDNQDQNGDDDNDGDGISDNVDKDDDNDCIPDIWDGSRKDFDDDGINDADDIDDDGDGFNDSEEVSDTSNMTNIYDADNDGYHDCSSMGMLHLNILDVQVNVLADGSVEFTIDASNLVDGENATVFWNLVDTDDFLQLNNSTTTVVVPSTGDIEEIGTWYGLPDGPYCLNVELSGSDASGNSDVLDSAQECFTIDSTSTGGGGGGATTNCPPEVLLSSRFSDNQTTFIFGVEDIDLYAYHPCLIGGVYEWNFSMTGPNGYMANEWSDGVFFIPQGPTDYDFNMKSYTRYDLSPGTYSWTYGLRNDTQGISEWFTHNFTVVNSSSTDDCDDDLEGRLSDNFDFTETTPTSQFDLLLTAECLMDDGQIYELVFQLWAEGATRQGQDNAGSGQWESYENSKNWSIGWFNPVSNVVKEWEGGHYTFKAMLYLGPETNGVKIDEINHDFCVTTASFNCNDSGGGSDDPSDNETEPVGYCSFPSFSATPTELFSGEDLTFTWSMDGDVSDQVYLALMSGWGAQYYFSSIEDNDGSHTITLPANMNPNADYTIYIESAYDDNRTTLCWKYGSIDILEEDEDIVIDDIIDMFLNTTDERPRISMWYGKVNQHNEEGTWMTDPDGVAGAGLHSQWGSEGWGDRKLEYCQRFWPDTVEIRTSAPEEIVFYTRGNTDAYLTMKPVWLCVQDTDGDGILDPEDQDDDGDGWADIIEEVCFSDALDANVVPADVNGDGLCDVLQNLLIEDYEPAESGFCTNGEITGGNGLLGQTEFVEVVLIERTGGNNQYLFEIQDTSSKLYEDIVQQPSNFDFVGYYEYYDVFVSNANGEFDMNGSFITIQARSNLGTSNLGVGHNIDSIGLRDANGDIIYATEVVAVELGDGLGADNPAGRQDQILGPADQASTFLGNNEASITVSFCPIDTASDDETVPGFGVMSALVALGAAMIAGRRAMTEDDE